jgi:hypothetical protein
MDFRNFRDIDWQLLFIRTYTWVVTVSKLFTSQTVKSVKYLAASFTPEVYAFYSGSSVPVRYTDYSKDVAGTSNVDFYYNRDTKTISKSFESSHLPRTLNIEGASLYHGDICLYDLTDFFDTTRYAGTADVPSLDQWVGIWQLENGIYLDRNKDFQLHIEFLGVAKSEVFSLWSVENVARWNQLTSSTPRLHRQVFRALNGPDCSCVPRAATVVAENTSVEETQEQQQQSTEVTRSMAWDDTSMTWREVERVADLSGNIVDLSGNSAPVEATPEN